MKLKIPLDKANVIIAALDLSADQADLDIERFGKLPGGGAFAIESTQRWLEHLAETRQWFLDSIEVKR